MTDRIQLAAVVDRLIYGSDTTFDAEDARMLDRLLPDDVRAGFLARFLRVGVKASMSGNTQGYAAGVGNVRIPDDKSFEYDSRGRCIVRAGQWKLCRNGRNIEIEQVLDVEGEKGAIVRYHQGEPTEMRRPTFWRLGFIHIGLYAPWKTPGGTGLTGLAAVTGTSVVGRPVT
jgi:hypothetical protein